MQNPIIKVRRANDRGHANHDWLDSWHTFSFADYYDPDFMGFRSLRVINEDRVDAAKGFGAHPHNNMEIFSYVIDGELKHKDSMGHESVINAGDVQKITAGTGIVHSEFNPSNKNKVHFLQIWIIPNKKNLTPSYQQISLTNKDRDSGLVLIGSLVGGKNMILFNQDVDVYRGVFKKNQEQEFILRPKRGVWIQIINGKLKVEQEILTSGDAVAIEATKKFSLKAQETVEFLLFDLA